MLELTLEKLREAAFFLHRLTNASHTIVGKEAEAFPYYLSAFLSAGRSVTFALQSEEKQKYDAWFTDWIARRSEEERALFGFMRDQRNLILKRGRAEVTSSLQVVPLAKAHPTERRQALAFQVFAPPGVAPSAVHRRVRRFDLNGTPSEVTVTCDLYYKVLERLVTDFLRDHEVSVEPSHPSTHETSPD